MPIELISTCPWLNVFILWISYKFIKIISLNLFWWISVPWQSCSSVLAACFLSSFAQNIVVVLCRVWDIYGRKSADRTEHGNDVIFLVCLATVLELGEIKQTGRWQKEETWVQRRLNTKGGKSSRWRVRKRMPIQDGDKRKNWRLMSNPPCT